LRGRIKHIRTVDIMKKMIYKYNIYVLNFLLQNYLWKNIFIKLLKNTIYNNTHPYIIKLIILFYTLKIFCKNIYNFRKNFKTFNHLFLLG